MYQKLLQNKKLKFSETQVLIWPRVHKETENEDQAQDQIDKFP